MVFSLFFVCDEFFVTDEKFTLFRALSNDKRSFVLCGARPRALPLDPAAF